MQLAGENFIVNAFIPLSGFVKAKEKREPTCNGQSVLMTYFVLSILSNGYHLKKAKLDSNGNVDYIQKDLYVWTSQLQRPMLPKQPYWSQVTVGSKYHLLMMNYLTIPITHNLVLSLTISSQLSFLQKAMDCRITIHVSDSPLVVHSKMRCF